MLLPPRLHGKARRGAVATLALLTGSLAACTEKPEPAAPVVVVAPVETAAPSASAAASAQAAESSELPPGLDGFFPLFGRAMGNGASAPAPRTALAFGRTTEKDVLRLVKNEMPSKPDKIDQNDFEESKVRYVMASWAHHFLIFKFSGDEGPQKGKLINAAFTVYYPHRHVGERQTSVYRAIQGARGAATSVSKFHYADEHLDDKLDLHVWDGTDAIITYRAYHDDNEDQDIVVVNFGEPAFFHSHKYWDY
jgi:hypothetical protein